MMKIFEAIREMDFEEMCQFWYLNCKQRGIKKTHEFLDAEYDSNNCHVVKEFEK
jgi:hypothetical protein